MCIVCNEAIQYCCTTVICRYLLLAVLHTHTHTHTEKFIGIVFERSILHVHVYLKAKMRGNTAKTVNQVAETVPSLSRNNSIPQVFNQN